MVGARADHRAMRGVADSIDRSLLARQQHRGGRGCRLPCVPPGAWRRAREEDRRARPLRAPPRGAARPCGGPGDTYTGVTMPPAPRPRLRPHEAIREIVRSKHEAFPSQLVKALLSEISVFPPGTLVRLNTGEVGRVTAVNRHHPLRPRVEIVADGKGQRLGSPKSTDLAEAPFLYITGAVAEGGR